MVFGYGSNYVAISAGSIHSIALLKSKLIIQWGNTDHGQEKGFDNVQKERDYVAISAGYHHNLALKTDGSIVQWGRTDEDQAKGKPKGTGFVAISAGLYHNLALKKDGSIVQWGERRRQQADDKPKGTGFVAIATGGWHNIALKKDGSIVQWGDTTMDVTKGLNNVQNEKFRLPSPIPIEMRGLPKNLQKNITKYENYKKILENRNLFNNNSFNNFENKLKNKTPAERRKIILQRTNFLNNTKNVGNLVNRQALYNTGNLVTQPVIKKILNSNNVSAAVKKKYVEQYKGPLTVKMIQNLKLNSENTLKLLTDVKTKLLKNVMNSKMTKEVKLKNVKTIETKLLKNVMNSKMNKKVKLGFVKKYFKNIGTTKTLNKLENMKMIDNINIHNPVTLNAGNHMLVNNLRINNKGKVMINYALNKNSIKHLKNHEINTLRGTTGLLKKLNSAKNISNTMTFYGANTRDPINRKKKLSPVSEKNNREWGAKTFKLNINGKITRKSMGMYGNKLKFFGHNKNDGLSCTSLTKKQLLNVVKKLNLATSSSSTESELCKTLTKWANNHKNLLVNRAIRATPKTNKTSRRKST